MFDCCVSSVSEISEPADRGVLMSGYQVVIQATALIGFWTAYATNSAISDSSDFQWQIPVGLQFIPGIVLLLGTLFIHETPHHVAGKYTARDVQRCLAWFRGLPIEDPEVSHEARSIYTSVHAAMRRQSLQPTSFIRTAFTSPIRKRLFVGIGLFVAQNVTGMNALNYFVPVVFLRIAHSVSGALFLTGIFGFVKLLSAFTYMFYSVRVGGNRSWLLSGTAVCAICMLVLGYATRASDSSTTDPAQSPGDVTAAQAVLAVASVYIFSFAFGVSSGPIAWNVCSEIFPSHLNAKCCAVTTCTQWACQIVIAALTPILLASIGTSTFTVFGICSVLGLLFCWACVPETRGVALGKEMAAAFGQQDDGKDDECGEIEEIEDVNAIEDTPLLGEGKRRRRSSVAIVV